MKSQFVYVLVLSLVCMSTTIAYSVEKESLKALATEKVQEGAVVEKQFMDNEIKDAVRKHLDKKAEQTGKLDFYDTQEDKVRHLDFVKMESATDHVNGKYIVKVEFFDALARQPVFLSISLKDKEGFLAFDGLELIEVGQPLELVVKEWTDQEILSFMSAQLDEKAEISGTIDVFHSPSQKVLNLQDIVLEKEVRHFGKLLIASAKAKDKESAKSFIIDVTVEVQNEKLVLKSLRLKQ